MRPEIRPSIGRLGRESPPLVRYGYIAAVAWVAAATVLFLPFRSALAGGAWGWPFLVVVGVVASTSGLGPGLLAALLSLGAENFFFIQPYGSFMVGQPEEVIQLLVFLVVALAWGWQAGRLRRRELAAVRNEAEAEALVELASRVVSETSRSSMASFLSGELEQLLGARLTRVWVIGEGTPAIAGPADAGDEAALPYVSYVQRESRAIGLPARHPGALDDSGAASQPWPASVAASAVSPDEPTTDVFLPLHTTSGIEGVLQVGWDAEGRGHLRPEDYRLLVSAGQMVAAFLAGRRLATAEAQADAVCEADRLKSALVSSVSHELKTPLASITAVVTDLSAEDVARDPSQVRERLGALTEDLGRLEASIADLLDTSRLEAGQWHAHVETWEAGEIIGDVAARMAAASRARITFDVADPGPTVAADFAQLSRALTTLVGNALNYGDGQPVVIGARPEGSRTLVWVEDQGPGVPDAEKERVFDKFYRGAAGQGRKGSTGLGLSIAHEIVQANGGALWVEDATPGPGARFVIALPSGSADLGEYSESDGTRPGVGVTADGRGVHDSDKETAT